MFISYYTAIVLISSLALLTISVGLSENHNVDGITRNRFLLLFFLLAFLNWTEWFGAYLNGRAESLRGLHIFVQYLEFIFTPFVPLACIRILISKNCSHIYTIPFHINIILQTVSLFNGCVFSIDGQNIYSRGFLYPLYLFIFVFSDCVLFYRAYVYSKKYQFSSLPFLLMICFMLIVAIIISVFIPNLRIDWSCASVAAILFFVYHRQLEHQVDSVTALLNRKSLDHDISVLDRDAAIIFFDVDNFKYVNDTFGHSFADECLCKLAGEMISVFESAGYCYRFGGDEACVILHKNISKTEKYIDKYIGKIDALRTNDERIPTISAGYAFFDPLTESAETAMVRADEMMYRNKEKAK